VGASDRDGFECESNIEEQTVENLCRFCVTEKEARSCASPQISDSGADVRRGPLFRNNATAEKLIGRELSKAYQPWI
jgi:hypothetical protein